MKYSHRSLIWLCFFSIFFIIRKCAAQDTLLNLALMDTAYSEKLEVEYETANKLFLESLKKETAEKKLYNYYERRYKAFFKGVREDIESGQMLNFPAISDKVEGVLSQIKKANQLTKNIQVVLLRNNESNAFTIGDNTIFLNIGLFYYLENESQLAAILSHETAHLVLEHTLKALRQSYEDKGQEEEKLKSLRSVQIGRADKAFDYIRSSIYKNENEMRLHEMEADSLGFIFLSNTSYKPQQFIRALEIMASFDTLRPSGVKTETYRQLFDLPEQKFKESWLALEDFSTYNYSAYNEKLNKDSVLSHPKSEDRIKHLQKIFPVLSVKSDVVSDKDFSNLTKWIKRQEAPNLFFNEQYGDVVYLSMLHLQNDTADEYYKEWLGKAFLKIAEARKNYRLNKYLERINPQQQTKSYRQFLSFMWNLKLEELNTIAQYYSTDNLSVSY